MVYRHSRLKCIKNNVIFLILTTYTVKAINGLGNQQDVIDATDAKTKLLDYTALQEQVNLSDNIQQNRKRLNEQSVALAELSFELTEHSGKIAKLETAVEHFAKGTFNISPNIS